LKNKPFSDINTICVRYKLNVRYRYPQYVHTRLHTIIEVMATKKDKWLQLIEFLVIGIVMGVLEDVIAIMLATDVSFSWRIVFVAFFVALPFAFFSELIVDHPRFWEIFGKGEKKALNIK